MKNEIFFSFSLNDVRVNDFRNLIFFTEMALKKRHSHHQRYIPYSSPNRHYYFDSDDNGG